jgi:hypothetical protein
VWSLKDRVSCHAAPFCQQDFLRIFLYALSSGGSSIEFLDSNESKSKPYSKKKWNRLIRESSPRLKMKKKPRFFIKVHINDKFGFKWGFNCKNTGDNPY